MKKTLVVIKFNDNVVIPSELAPELVLGDKDDFFDAQHLITTRLENEHITLDTTSFSAFVEAYKSINLDLPLVNLYYLIKKVPFVSEQDVVGNFLNYFTFIYSFEDEKEFDRAFAPVSELFSRPEVDYWWCERPMMLCNTTPPVSSPSAPVNVYYDSLRFLDFGSTRGAGVAIVDAEDFGNEIQHPYLYKRTVTVLHGYSMTGTHRVHFYNTVGVLFAVPPLINPLAIPPLPEPEPIFGIAPDAQLVALAFDNAPVSTHTPISPAYQDEFIVNYFQRTYIPKMLAEPALIRKGNILLFERMVEVPVGSGQSYYLPLEVLPDMRKSMLTCQRNSIIVIQPAGQFNIQPDFYLDRALKQLGQRRNPRYTDFSSSITAGHEQRQQSVCVTIGALAADYSILPKSNAGQIVDVYLWGVGITTLNYPDPSVADPPLFADYTYTSAASAIAAGIVACLQSVAYTHNKILTTTHIKNVFNRTFCLNRHIPDGKIFTPTTLKKLWDECAIELSIPPTQPTPRRTNPHPGGPPYVPQPDESGN